MTDKGETKPVPLPPAAASSRAPQAGARPGFAKLSVTALALLVAGMSVVASIPGAGRHRRMPPPQPRKAVEIDRYLGRWYEFARYPVWFERGAEAVTADYSLRPDGLIRVVNTAHRGGLSGPLSWSEARARALPGTGQAKLKVSFLPLVWGDYWILDHADDYSWSIVGEGSRRHLWILTRVPHPPPAERALLLTRVQSLGYDTRRLHLTHHPVT